MNMKRKYAAMILGLTLALTSANLAYAAGSSDTATEAVADTSDTTEAVDDTTSDTTEETADSAESTEVYGEVTEVGTDSITINVGTLKEGQAPQDGEKPDGEAPSMLDLTGESQDIKVTDTTTYEKQAAPEKPDGEAPDGEKPEDAKDDNSDEKTDADDKDADSTDTEATTDDSKADGQAPEMQTESIALTDIQVGDTIKVTLDADGNATAVVVMNAGAPEEPGAQDGKDGDAKDADSKDAKSDESSEASDAGSTDSTADGE